MYWLNADNARVSSPASADGEYQGPKPNSEKETQALVDLLCTSPIRATPSGDPAITWIFDIHGQEANESKVSYPWGFEPNQMGNPAMCLLNPAYDPSAQVSRRGYRFDHNSHYPMFGPLGTKIVPSTTNTRYGEYMPRKTASQIKALATAFIDGAEQCLGNNWEVPTQGAARYPCVGYLDDYSVWLDRNHVRALTVECAELHPDDKSKRLN